MEKEIAFDQEIITINVAEDIFSDQHPANKTEVVLEEDYTVADESDIDWSKL